MFKETTKNQRIIATIVAIVVGFYLMIIAPTQAMTTLKLALHAVMGRLIPLDPDFYTAVPILGATFGIWMILIAFGGALLLVVARGIYKGSLEARATGLGIAGIAAVAGMTMFIPWMVLIVSDYSQGPVPGISPPDADVTLTPPVLWIMAIGLLAYFTFLLMDKDSLINKLLKTVVYTAIGVVSGMVFMNAQHGVRYFEFIPEYLNEVENLDRHDNPFGNQYTNLDYYDALALTTISQAQMDSIKPNQAIDIVHKDKTVESIVVKKASPVYNPNTIALFLGGYGNYIASYLMILMVPFVFLRKKWAYNTLLMATVLSASATFWNYFVRGSFEWVVGGMMSVGLLVILLIPVFKQFLVEDTQEENIK